MTEPAADSWTLPAAIRAAARRDAGRGVTLFGRGGSERRTVSEIAALAERGARRLAALGVLPGEPVLVALPTSWAWFEVWLGALLLGALPAAIAPSGAKGQTEGHVHKVDGALETLGTGHLVCEDALRSTARELGMPRPAAGRTVDELPDPARGGPPPRTGAQDPGATAFLQLTSGSTARPRAVPISHRGALANLRAIDVATSPRPGVPASAWIEGWVSWLPLHHDMGLVGAALNALVSGFDLWLTSPRDFVAAPRLWLEALSAHGTRLATAPTFGYQLCVDRAHRIDGSRLDLSQWASALIGAEMIRPEVISAFCERFAVHGFAPSAATACYGLAEATLAVTVDQRREGLRTLPSPDSASGGVRVACVGAPVPDTELRVVAPDGTPRPAGEIGRVLVRGPGVASGYHGDPEATAATFRDGWLHTGDLGFLVDGELYLTGREKDLLIVRGQNVAPYEVEWIAEKLLGGTAGYGAAAFSVPARDGDQGESIVLVAEAGERDGERLAAFARELRLRVADELYLPIADVAFVPRGDIPRTTSGKKQRQELRRRYLAGDLDRRT